MSESYDFFLAVENLYFLGYKLDWTKMVIHMLFCSSWWGALNDVSVFYTYPLFTRNTVFGEPLPGNSSLWWTLGIANVLLLHIVTILWNPYQVTSLCYESFFFPRPLSLTSHLVITFIFDVFICVMFYSLNVHRNSPFKIKSNMKNYLNLSMKF